MKISESDLQKLVAVMEKENLSVKQVIKLIRSNVKGQKVINTAEEIKLVIDYTETVKEAVAKGKYDWKSRAINAKNFPTSPEMTGKKVEASAKLFHFDHDTISENAISEMNKAGYRPATLMELLALGSSSPELQRQFTIVALGSIWCNSGDNHYVPYLGVDTSERELYLSSFTRAWFPNFCFLGIRK